MCSRTILFVFWFGIGEGSKIEEVYANNRSWSDVLAEAGETLSLSGPHETALRRACGRLLHVDDSPRLQAYRSWLSEASPPAMETLSIGDRRWLRMLLSVLSGSVAQMNTSNLADACSVLWTHDQVRKELCELFDLLSQRTAHLGQPLMERSGVPLQVHARYSRSEIQAAFGDRQGNEEEHDRVAPPTWREGVKWMSHERCDVFLITLNKTEKRFSPTTRYRDYAVSRDLLHWESQSGTTEGSPTGQRYQRHAQQGTEVMIFARMNAEDRAFHFLGPATYLRHQGELPMQITWRLKHSLPGDLFLSYRVAVA